MRVGALCSGYGGIEIGLEHAGEDIEVVWHAEVDDAPAMVHGKHWPGPNLGDITAVDWSTVEPVDLLTAGYPCQPFSTAGRRKGTDDERHLWPHVAEAVRALRPRLVFLENVAGHLTLGFDVVAADLAQMGYEFRWGCVRASDAGAPHRRERLFILATDPDQPGPQGPQPAQRRDVPTGSGGVATDTRSAGTGRDDRAVPGPVQGRPGVDVRAVGDDDRGLATDTRSSVGRRSGNAEPGDGGTADGRRGAPQPRGRRGTPADAGRCGRYGFEAVPAGLGVKDRQERGRRQGDRDAEPCGSRVDWGPYEPAIRRWEHLTRPAPAPTDDRGRLNPPFVEWMMGLPEGWVTDHGLPRTAELKMLGNGVVPQAAALAWSLLSDPSSEQAVS